MVQEFPNTSALLQYAEEQQLYHDLVLQLRKDFLLANISFDFRDDVSPMELMTLVQEKVYRLIMERFDEYLNLLYIIDVPERRIKAIETDNVVEISAQVGFEILRREWQKVWFRKKYDA